MGWKELFAHKRTWALIIGLLLQALTPLLGAIVGNENIGYLTQHAPYLLAALWTALVLGQAYEDRVTNGASSALTVHRGPTEEGGWKFALLSLFRNEKFVATTLGTMLAVIALCIPWWTGLKHLEVVFTRVADLVVFLTSSLTIGLAYSSAHDEMSPSSVPENVENKEEEEEPA